MGLLKLIRENKQLMGLLTARSGKQFIFRPDETGDYNWLGWEIDSDYTRGQTHKWYELPKGDIEWFDIDNPPETVNYLPIIN